MLGSIGRVLRQLGIDTIILKGESIDHDECIRISQNEDRVILTASKPLFTRVSQLKCHEYNLKINFIPVSKIYKARICVYGRKE